MKDNDEYRHLSNASSLIRIVSKRLQTQEFLMMIKNKWSEGRLSDVKRSGDSFQRTFERLKRLAIRLQKTFGADYQSDNMMCDFYSRALQDEPFWTWVYDYEPNITSDKMCGRSSTQLSNMNAFASPRCHPPPLLGRSLSPTQWQQR